MAINLTKGQRIDLTKTNPQLKKLKVALSWSPNFSIGAEYDIDVSAFILNQNEKLISENHFVFYNNLESPNKSVVHTGDERTGRTEDDDEVINVDLSKIDSSASEIIFLVTIHEAEIRNQNFGQIRDSKIAISNIETGESLLSYILEEDCSIETSMVFGRLYKSNNEWKFHAVGTGSRNDISHYVNKYINN